MSKFLKSKNLRIFLSTMLSLLMIFSIVPAAAYTPAVETTVEAAIPNGVYSYNVVIASPPMPTPDSAIISVSPPRGGWHHGMGMMDMDTNIEEQLRDVLTAARTHFDIDDEVYTAFNYHVFPDSFGINVWHLSWNSANWESSIHMSLLSCGNILSYHRWNHGSFNNDINRISFAEISRAEAKTAAEEFLGRIMRAEFGDYRLVSNSIRFPSDRYDLVYVRTANGFDFPEFSIFVSVDKMTGEILSFERRGSAAPSSDISFQDPSSTITTEEALASYLENIGIELVYLSHFDWRTRELIVHPVYRLKNTHNEFISAVSGEVITTDHHFGIVPFPILRAEYGMAFDSDFGGIREIRFSEAELAEIERARDFITSARAIEIMIEAFNLELGDLSDFDIHTHLQQEYVNQEQFLWHISLSRSTDTMHESYHASVDARNGNIISYSSWTNSFIHYFHITAPTVMTEEIQSRIENVVRGIPVSPDLLYTYDEAKAIVLNQIREISPHNIDDNFELVESHSIDSGEKWGHYNFHFVRKVNGIRFESNFISVGFDNTTGKITSYTLTWFENAEFPALNNIITPAAALNGIADFSGYNIYYIVGGMTHHVTEDFQVDAIKLDAVLVYRFDNPVWVDPFTGNAIGWNFEELEITDTVEPNYQDLAGHWSEEIVNILTNNGIFVWGGDRFEPDRAITRGELIDYLSFYTNNSWAFTEVESSVFAGPFQHSRHDELLNTNLNELLTKQAAAKIICEIAGYGAIARHYQIFVYPFADDNFDDEYRGYIAILSALGIISGDDDNNFNARENLTRAGAAQIVYNIVRAFNS